jgi:hypothetical protein
LPQDYLANLFEEVISLQRNPEFLDQMRDNLEMIEDANRKDDLISDLVRLAEEGPRKSWWRFWLKSSKREGVS